MRVAECMAELLAEGITSIAVVGASERSFMCGLLVGSLREYGFAGEVWPVHPRETTVFGLPTHRSVAALPGPPSIGVLVLRADRCLTEVAALRNIGCRLVVVFSDGFAETNEPDGVARQRALTEYCQAHDVVLIGPNCVGVADFAAGVAAVSLPLPPGLTAGRVSLFAQSGALLFSMLAGLRNEHVGVDLVLSIGNAAGLGVIDALELCMSRPGTDTVCGYVEGFGSDPRRLADVLRHADAVGKRVILVRTGTSEVARRIAMSHTATIAGPSRHVDALCARYGVVRVPGIEDMVRTAALVGNSAGLLVLTSTGGGAGLAGDLAAAAGVTLAELGVDTLDRLRDLVPNSGFLGNPMDLSAQVAGGRIPMADLYDVLLSDPGVRTVLFVGATGFPDDRPSRQVHRRQLDELASATDKHGVRLVVAGVVHEPWTEWLDSFLADHPGTVAVAGIAATLAAIGRLQRVDGDPAPAAAPPARSAPAAVDAVLDEAEGRAALTGADLAVVPGDSAATEDDAVAIADRVGYPVVVKGVVPGLSHKFAAGAVVLGCCDADAVRQACRRIADRIGANPALRLTGFLVEGQVAGTELLVGLTRDGEFGPAVTLGVGGTLAETTDLNATALLPLGGRATVARLAGDAGLTGLLTAFGHATGAAVLDYVHRLGTEFTEGRLAGYATVEVNPLFVTPAGDVLAGDVLMVRRT